MIKENIRNQDIKEVVENHDLIIIIKMKDVNQNV